MRRASITLLFCCAALSRADVVAYREIFAHSGTDAPNFTNGLPTNGGLDPTIDWQLRGANMTGQITNLASGGPVNTVAAGNGIVTNLSSVNAGSQQGTQIAQGFAVIPGTNLAPVLNGAPYILYTSEFALGRPGVTRFSWYQGNQSASDRWRVALEMDGSQWYVSDAFFTNAAVTSGIAFATNGEFKQLSMASAQWRTLNFNGSLAANSGSLAVGSITSLAGSTITRFGMYTDAKSNNMRFDTFQIDTVPEPSSFAVAALAAFGLRKKRIRR
jgi:hypothetical protein